MLELDEDLTTDEELLEEETTITELDERLDDTIDDETTDDEIIDEELDDLLLLSTLLNCETFERALDELELIELLTPVCARLIEKT